MLHFSANLSGKQINKLYSKVKGTVIFFHIMEMEIDHYLHSHRLGLTMDCEGEQLINHFTHCHSLSLFGPNKEDDHRVYCAICEKLCSDSAYGCKSCEFFLHKSCMTEIRRHIDHHCFHPDHPLVLLPNPSSYKCCGCDNDASRLIFRCKYCTSFQLDAKCALLPTLHESKDATQIQHFSHRHPLDICENKHVNDSVRCKACGENCLDISTFGCNRCKFYLHRSCAVEFPQRIRNHPFHPQHLLEFSPDYDGSTCSACGRYDDSLLAYECLPCDFKLHTDCVRLAPYYNYVQHQHPLALFVKTSSTIYCNICFETCKQFFLRCVVCEFNIHFYCHPSIPKSLPEPIRRKFHVHPLTLSKPPFQFELNSPEDEYNSDDEFYCDVCEEKRDKSDQVYYCENCKFIAEIGCVIHELLPCLPRNCEDSAINSNLAKLNKEIEEHDTNTEPLKVEIEHLEEEIKRLAARLEELKEQTLPTKRDQLEKERCMCISLINQKHNMKEDKHSTEASTSQELPSNQSQMILHNLRCNAHFRFALS